MYPNYYMLYLVSVQYEPIVTPGNEAYVYRIVFYRCDMNGADIQGQAFDCETAPVQVKSCKTTVATWSMGAEVMSQMSPLSKLLSSCTTL